MENSPEVLRYAAFATTPDGGNPAGLVLDARHLDEAGMLAVAAAVGYWAGSFTFDTPVGVVVTETAGDGAGITASFTAVEPRLAEFDDAVLAELLGLFGVGQGDLDPARHTNMTLSPGLQS
jgi:predicted PhzF superfamily epimerase YddE/YHI9